MVSMYLPRVVLMKRKYCQVDGMGVVPSISTQKQFNCSSRLLNCYCEQICPVLSVLNYLSILFVAIYMYGDMLSYIDEFNFVLFMHYNNYICQITFFMGLIGMLIFHALILSIQFHFLSFVLRNI